MSRLMRIFRRCRRCDSGQDLIEYALILTILGLATAAIMSNLASSIATTLTGMGNKLTSTV